MILIGDLKSNFCDQNICQMLRFFNSLLLVSVSGVFFIYRYAEITSYLNLKHLTLNMYLKQNLDILLNIICSVILIFPQILSNALYCERLY